MQEMRNYPDNYRSLASAQAIQNRRELLHESHIQGLTRFVDELNRPCSPHEIPYFDPMDGGSEAKLLFLMEKPGPKAGMGGSGFISRDNNDQTAENIFNFMKKAGVDRSVSIIWNVIPWWDGQVAFESTHVNEGIGHLKTLFARGLLKHVTTVVCVGNAAKKANKFLPDLGLKVFVSAHPSPQVKRFNPELWHQIPYIWWLAKEASEGRDPLAE